MKKTGVELTGVKEIARRANVSIGTVDRVIHNRQGVSELTRKKINAIIEELTFSQIEWQAFWHHAKYSTLPC
jgi:LacI family transcriptional regulator